MKHPQKKISLAIFAVLLGATTFSPAGYAVPGGGGPAPAPAPVAAPAAAPTPTAAAPVALQNRLTSDFPGPNAYVSIMESAITDPTQKRQWKKARDMARSKMSTTSDRLLKHECNDQNGKKIWEGKKPGSFFCFKEAGNQNFTVQALLSAAQKFDPNKVCGALAEILDTNVTTKSSVPFSKTKHTNASEVFGRLAVKCSSNLTWLKSYN